MAAARATMAAEEAQASERTATWLAWWTGATTGHVGAGEPARLPERRVGGGGRGHDRRVYGDDAYSGTGRGGAGHARRAAQDDYPAGPGRHDVPGKAARSRPRQPGARGARAQPTPGRPGPARARLAA